MNTKQQHLLNSVNVNCCMSSVILSSTPKLVTPFLKSISYFTNQPLHSCPLYTSELIFKSLRVINKDKLITIFELNCDN